MVNNYLHLSNKGMAHVPYVLDLWPSFSLMFLYLLYGDFLACC